MGPVDLSNLTTQPHSLSGPWMTLRTGSTVVMNLEYLEPWRTMATINSVPLPGPLLCREQCCLALNLPRSTVLKPRLNPRTTVFVFASVIQLAHRLSVIGKTGDFGFSYVLFVNITKGMTLRMLNGIIVNVKCFPLNKITANFYPYYNETLFIIVLILHLLKLLTY